MSFQGGLNQHQETDHEEDHTKTEPRQPATAATLDPETLVASAQALPDDALSEAIELLTVEKKRRAEEAKAKLPQPGTKVRVVSDDKRFKGKEGVVMVTRKTRAYVQVPMEDGKVEVAYLRMAELEEVKA